MLFESEVLRFDSPQFRAMSEAILASGAAIRFKARGLSMQPNLLDGDTVLVAPVPISDLKIGDVVLTEASQGLKLHRIVSIDCGKRQIITRGDASRENDFPVENVLGRVVEIERSGRRLAFAGPFRSAQQTVRRLARRLRLAVTHQLEKVFVTSDSRRPS